MSSIKDQGLKILSKTWNTVNRAVAPINNTRQYAFDSKKDFIFKLTKSPSNAPTSIQKMQFHSGVGQSIGGGKCELYLLTHVPPLGVPNVKIDHVDYKGNNMPQYLVGPIIILECDSDYSGVSDCPAAPQIFGPSSNLKEKSILQSVENYFINDVNRENIRLAVFDLSKFTVAGWKQIGKAIIDYNK